MSAVLRPLALLIASMAAAAVATAAFADPYPVFRFRSGLASPAPAPGGGAPGEGPRFIPLAVPPTVSAREGESVDVAVGDYEGEPSQWSCSPFLTAPWLGCKFDGGTVRLVGVAEGERTGPVDVTVVRTGYTVTAAVPVTVTASVPTYTVSELGDRYVQSGQGARIAIGSFTGKPEGWSCTGRSSQMADWQSCSFEKGRVYLVGTAPMDHGYNFNSYDIRHRGEVKGYTSLFWLFRSTRGYDSPPTLDAPRPAKATFAAARDLYVPQGSSHRFKVGTYTGGDGGWACFGRNGQLASWLDCEFKDGGIFLTVNAPERTYSFNGIGAVRDGVVVGQGDLSWVHTDNRGYTQGAPQTEQPRVAQVSMSRAVDRYAVAGETTRFKIGTYTGGDGGWTCFGSQNQMPGWLGCEFKDGDIIVVASPSERTNAYNGISIVRDGVRLGTSDLFWTHVDNRGYVQGAAATLEPRGGSASLARTSDRYAVAGETTRFKVGTYTGGDGGWTCFGYMSQMPSWVSCEFKDGNIYHVVSPGERTYTYNAIAVVRDGVQVSRGDGFWLHADAKGYAQGAANTEEPRAGTASLPSFSDMTAPGGERWERKVGTYTGGDGGWSCYGYQNPLPSWASCRFFEGNIFLEGTAPADAKGSAYAFVDVAIVRDGYEKARGNLFWLKW